MSIAHSASASSIGTHGVPVAADAGAVAERLVERLAERDPDVLDRVVTRRSRGRRSPRPRGPSSAVAAEQLEHVVEEADPGLGRDLAAAEVELEARSSVSRVSRSIVACSCRRSSPRPLGRGLAVHRKALGPGQRVDVRAPILAPPTSRWRRPSPAHERARPERARRTAPRRPSAARGWSRRRSRRTRSPRREPTNTQPATRPRALASSAPSNASSRCSGASASASSSARCSPGAVISASGASATDGRSAASAVTRSATSSSRTALCGDQRQRACRRRARPGRRGPARAPAAAPCRRRRSRARSGRRSRRSRPRPRPRASPR